MIDLGLGDDKLELCCVFFDIGGGRKEASTVSFLAGLSNFKEKNLITLWSLPKIIL